MSQQIILKLFGVELLGYVVEAVIIDRPGRRSDASSVSGKASSITRPLGWEKMQSRLRQSRPYRQTSTPGGPPREGRSARALGAGLRDCWRDSTVVEASSFLPISSSCDSIERKRLSNSARRSSVWSRCCALKLPSASEE
eukprot:8014536-Pyramimonas_sp.AAC.1